MKIFSQTTPFFPVFYCFLLLGCCSPLAAQVGELTIVEEQAVTAKPVDLEKHTVKKGESLYGISKKYKVSIEDITTANKMADNTIQPGQVLIIDPGAHERSLAASSTRSINARTANPQEVGTRSLSSSGGQQMVTTEQPLYYTVRKGDDIFSISDSREVTVSQLKEWNPGSNFVAGERVIVGKEMLEMPAASNARMANTSTRSLDNLDPANTSGDLSSLGVAGDNSSPAMATRSAAPSSKRETVSVMSKETGKVYELPAITNLGSNVYQASYGEASDPRIKHTRFYGFHKDIPIGTKVNLTIPGNAGYLQVEVVGRLDPSSRVDIGLSPACMALLKGAKTGGYVTLNHN